MSRRQSISNSRHWEKAIERAETKGVNRVTRHWSHDEAGTVETFFRVTSATTEGQGYAVRVYESADGVSALCNCECGFHGRYPCWHMAAVLMKLGYLRLEAVA